MVTPPGKEKLEQIVNYVLFNIPYQGSIVMDEESEDEGSVDYDSLIALIAVVAVILFAAFF